MDYSLALELKNAGFPQRKVDGINPDELYLKYGYPMYRCAHNNEKEQCRDPYSCVTKAFVPNLGELIEAFRGKFAALMVGPGLGLWTAKGNGIEIHQSTPEEAVEKLWLALNKK